MAETVKKTKKKKKRRLTPTAILLCLVAFGVSFWMIYNAFSELMTTFTLQQQLSEVQARLQEVQDENAYLTDQKEKLQDPDYVESYARGTFQLTKDGEHIYILPGSGE